MSTVDKAISLLALFSVDVPERGLTDIAKRAGFDKATTRRLLMSLSRHSLVEQDTQTRRYRLGAGLTRLARIREARIPLLRMAQPVVRDLATATAETVHLAEAVNGHLLSVLVEHPPRANRVNVEVGVYLPLHSTASGIAYLSHISEEMVRSALREPLPAYTAQTLTDLEMVLDEIRTARARGYSVVNQGFEDGVFSVAAAVLGPDGDAIGTLAIAAPLARSPKGVAAERGKAVAAAARAIGAHLSGALTGPVVRVSA